MKNPFINIKENEGLKKNEDSPFYGRFRLEFNQVFPFREPLYDCVILKIIKNIEDVKTIYSLFPEHIKSVVRLHKQKDVRNNKYNNLNFFEDETYFLEFVLVSDVKYIAMENFYFAIKELSNYIEECHFFIYSSGDLDDRWIDEYKIKDGKLFFNRNICDEEIYYGRLNFYYQRVLKNPKDENFVRFTLYQFYDRISFWTKNTMEFDDENHSKFLDKLYKIDASCTNLEAINKKYKFHRLMRWL